MARFQRLRSLRLLGFVPVFCFAVGCGGEESATPAVGTAQPTPATAPTPAPGKPAAGAGKFKSVGNKANPD